MEEGLLFCVPSIPKYWHYQRRSSPKGREWTGAWDTPDQWSSGTDKAVTPRRSCWNTGSDLEVWGRPKILHTQQALGHCWCCWSTEPTWNNKGAWLRSESAGRKEVRQGPWEEEATGSRERWFHGALQPHHLSCTAFLAGPLAVHVLVTVGCYGPSLSLCSTRAGPEQLYVGEGWGLETSSSPPTGSCQGRRQDCHAGFAPWLWVHSTMERQFFQAGLRDNR